MKANSLRILLGTLVPGTHKNRHSLTYEMWTEKRRNAQAVHIKVSAWWWINVRDLDCVRTPGPVSVYTVRTTQRFKDITNNDHVRGESKNVLGSRHKIPSSFNQTHSNRTNTHTPEFLLFLFFPRSISSSAFFCFGVRFVNLSQILNSSHEPRHICTKRASSIRRKTEWCLLLGVRVSSNRSLALCVRYTLCAFYGGETILLVRTDATIEIQRSPNDAFRSFVA